MGKRKTEGKRAKFKKKIDIYVCVDFPFDSMIEDRI